MPNNHIHDLSSFPPPDPGDWRYAADTEHEARLQENAESPAAQDEAIPGGHVRETGTPETGVCVCV